MGVKEKLLPPEQLNCEYLENPLGVDIATPRFSWILQSNTRGQQQRAYRIIVSSSFNLAEEKISDVWDSKKKVTPQTSNIPFDGEKLASIKRYFWRVKWWDENSVESEFSKTAFFETGFLNKYDWKARWISRNECREFYSKGTDILGEKLSKYHLCHALYFRKEFHIDKIVTNATACICGLGIYEFYINGYKVGTHVLDPAQTDFNKIALYSSYNVTKLLTQKNAVGVILGNGRHIRNFGYDIPRLILQIQLLYDDGSTSKFISDESWKVAHGPLMENGLYYGERYDARNDFPGWHRPEFNDASWDSVISVNGPPLASQLMPPIRVTKTLKAQHLSSPQPGVFIYDFGQNFSGFARLKVRGPAGTEIKMRYAELLHGNGTLNTATNQNAKATDIYILKGKGVEVYEPRFTYHGFRYIEMTGFPGNPALENLEGRFIHSDVPLSGNFTCSDELINKIHECVVWGQLSNLMSIPTDCPQRDERHGWMGDAHLSAEEAIHNFDMAAFYTKYLSDIQLSQKGDGSLPDTVPPYFGETLLHPTDPAWGAAYIILCWYMYFYYGDTRILERHYQSLKKYILFLRSNAEDNILRRLGKYGDWCPPGSIGPKETPVVLTSTWYYYYQVLLFSKIAKILKHKDDFNEYDRLAKSILKSFNRTFLINGCYTKKHVSPVDNSPNQTSNALPLYLDMVPGKSEKKVVAQLLHSIINIKDYHLDTGILGTKYIIDALTKYGYADVAFKVLTKKSYPSLGYMISEGATTIWERWEKLTGKSMNSHNHIMFGSVDTWFYSTLGGIVCLEPGWKSIKIKPHVPDDLSFVKCEMSTIAGKICVAWNKTDVYFEMCVKIPVGVTAAIMIPILWENSFLQENGKTLWASGKTEVTDLVAISTVDRVHNRFIYKVECGEFRFELFRK